MKPDKMKLTDDELLNELKKRFEENTQTMNELRKLNEQLLEVNRKLTESEALKSHFISNISNEIINPFASILGLARHISMLEEGKSVQIKKMAELIHSEAFILDFQLKNIFAAAEIESGEIIPHFSIIDIKKTIENVILSFEHDIRKKNLNIVIYNKKEESVKFATDADKMHLILANLLSNAIKFSYDKNKIIFEYEYTDKMLTISVTDFGTGITKENQKIIFDRFQRIDTGINSINRGHGLGLSVIKSYLDLLYGKIRVESQQGEGSKFSISLPETTENVTNITSDGGEFFMGSEEIL